MRRPDRPGVGRATRWIQRLVDARRVPARVHVTGTAESLGFLHHSLGRSAPLQLHVRGRWPWQRRLPPQAPEHTCAIVDAWCVYPPRELT